MRFEILPGLPANGSPALPFPDNGAARWREGLVVRFHTDSAESWVGNFLGGFTKCNSVLSHPDGKDVIVIAQGEAFVVDPVRRVVRSQIGGDIEEIIPIASLGLVVFRGLVDFEAIGAAGYRWRSPRISWDGFRDVKVGETELAGEAYTPLSDSWVPFKLDLLTGNCLDGIYEREFSRAAQVMPKQRS